MSEKKIKLICILSLILISLSTFGSVGITSNQTLSQEQYLDLNVGHPNVVHVGQTIDFYIEVCYDGLTEIKFSLQLLLDDGVTNSTLYYNDSIYFDSNSKCFYEEVSLSFDNTGYYDVWLITITDSGGKYFSHSWLEVSAFQLFLDQDYEAYVGQPTWFIVGVDYYDYGSEEISVEVQVDREDEIKESQTIFINSSIIFSGVTPPESYWHSFSYTFHETGYYMIQFDVIDIDTGETWTRWSDIEVKWLEINIYHEGDIFVGNTTTIEFEVLSSINQLIYVDISLSIIGYSNNEVIFEEGYGWKNIPMDGTVIRDRINDSKSLIFDSKGKYEVFLSVFDKTNEKVIEEYRNFRVHETLELWFEYEKSVDISYPTWLYFEVNYYGTDDIIITVELLLDDGFSNQTIFYNGYIQLSGQIPGSFNSDNFNKEFEITFDKIGYYDVWMIVNILGTEKVFYEHSWFEVFGKENNPPTIIEVTELNDDTTYSGEIIINVTITDESIVSWVKMRIENENDSAIFKFDELVYNKSYWSSSLFLDTEEIYDGEYKVEIEAEDEHGNSRSEYFWEVRFQNGNMYVLSSEKSSSSSGLPDITPGFEGIMLILSIITSVVYLKRRNKW